ncbi:MAG: OmpA family protein [Bacteroidales bacterium]|nr:OmpA family protein [Bacteroidales bacterium]
MNSFITLIFLGIILAGFSQEPKATEKEALMWVTVSNMEGVPLVGEKIEVEAASTKIIVSAITNDKGKCWFLLKKGETFDIRYKEIEKSRDYQKIQIPNEEGLFEVEAIIMYEPAKSYTLENVYFDTGKATLKPSSFVALDELVDFMKRKKSTIIEIGGHTDNVGDDNANLTLSQQRAESVKNYLLKNGIEESRVQAKGYGETKFIAPNDSEENRQKNRRTEVTILSN